MKDSRPVWHVQVDDPAHDCGGYLELFRANDAREAAERFGRWWDVETDTYDIAGGGSLDVVVWPRGDAEASQVFTITGHAVSEYEAQPRKGKDR